MAELRIPIIVENKGKKAFGEANKQVNALDKGVKKLGASLAGVFGAQQLLRFAKNASKAFIEDEKAVAQLTQSVKNLGLAFDLPVINGFIDKLSLAAGVADDKLRPSMQKLLQVTGSVSKSQELLIQGLDISRGSGIEFETVIQDLAAAYVGNTRGLRKYNLGLTQAELKTLKFADAQERLTTIFSGANATYLDTYAGKMELLGVAAGEAQEIIGQGLIDSLMILSGDTTVQELADTMLDLAENTATALTNLGKFGRGVVDTFGPIATVLEKFIRVSQPFADLIIEGDPSGFMDRPRPRARRFFAGGQDSIQEAKLQKARAEADKKANANAKRYAALQAKILAAQKKAAALSKAAQTLDLERIGLTAALKGQISETDRISLQLQLALLDKNDALATKLAADLETAIQRNMKLQAALLATPEAPNPYRNWTPPEFGKPLPQGFTPPSYPEPAPNPQGPKLFVPPNMSNVPSDSFTQYGPQGGLMAGVIAGVNPQPVVNVTVSLDGQELTSIITETQTNDTLSGSFGSLNRSGFKGAVAI